ncbi:soluble lytic murein transglycosylase [endosymbiont of unidentified scaly snail isolate Monju]|nr:soluble lytic murein transglycosylase [endosymbiont of unidentified scaly snail isolate Monju]
MADMLRRNWLDLLARKRRWRLYLADYVPQRSVQRQSHHLQALIETGRAREAWPRVEKIWLHGRSRPRACDPVFAAWERAGRRTPELTWQRIALAMKAGQTRLARYLGKKLDSSERDWVERWIRVHRHPRAILDDPGFRADHLWRETILLHAVTRQARNDGLAALRLWRAVRNRYPFTREQRHAIARRIALALDHDDSEQAYAWILSVTPAAGDTRLYTARLNAALLRHDWQQLLADLPNWPTSEHDSERRQYWMARALEGAGRHEAARAFYRRLAKKRSYYGFLAADRIGAPYHLLDRQTPADLAAIAQVRHLPGVRRALELHALSRNEAARREWHYATRRLDQQALQAAALIAESANWHDQAIFTLARTGYWDDLQLRFPLEHQEIVIDQSRQNALDTAWIYAVIRQESAFMADAHSQAGALGLMQLMPATARTLARREMGLGHLPGGRLLDPAFNIRLGSAYLKELKEKLADNPVLATAAYNAGPHRVDRWLPPYPLEADIWVELIPFGETRRYLRRVMSYTVIYDKRLGRKPRRLRPPVRSLSPLFRRPQCPTWPLAPAATGPGSCAPPGDGCTPPHACCPPPAPG